MPSVSTCDTTETRKSTETQRKPTKRIAHEELNELTREVIGSAIEVHKALGPGFIERVYTKALQMELRERQVPFSTEVTIRLKYRGQQLGIHRLDFVVSEKLIVELKVVYEINRFHIAQILSYLKASGLSLGLVLNFARGTLEIKRVAL